MKEIKGIKEKRGLYCLGNLYTEDGVPMDEGSRKEDNPFS